MAAEKLEIGDIVVWADLINDETLSDVGHGPFIIRSVCHGETDENGDLYYQISHMDGRKISNKWSWTIKKDVFLNEVRGLAPANTSSSSSGHPTP